MWRRAKCTGAYCEDCGLGPCNAPPIFTYPPELLPYADEDGAEVIVVYQGDTGGTWLHLIPTMGEPYMDGPSDCLMMIPRNG